MTVTRVATGTIGVLNNKRWIYENGQRTVMRDGEPTVIPAESGKVLAGQAHHIDIDGVLSITSESPLPIRYVASSGPTRGRATDFLYLNHVDETKAYRAGEVISRYSAVIQISDRQ